MTPDLDALVRELWRVGEGQQSEVFGKWTTVLRATVLRAVVEVTGQMVYEALVDTTGEDSRKWRHLDPQQQDDYNRTAARLRARAGAPQPQRISRPAPVASALVVPEDGLYWCEFDNAVSKPLRLMAGAAMTYDDCTRIRRIDTDEPTTWIERTPAIVGAWTAEVCAQFVGRRVFAEDEHGDWRVFKLPRDGADVLASTLNGIGAAAVHILPDRVEAPHA